jgi:hypothetical protein
VPSNLVQYLLELALPPVSLAGSAVYASRGDVRKSAQLFIRSMMGFSMYYVGNMLFDAGVIIASGEGDDEAERQMKQEVARPASINTSALRRFLNGADPTFKEDDDIRDLTKLGQFGLFLAYMAEWNETIRRDQKKPRQEVSLMEQSFQAFASGLKTSLELPFLQGSFEALKAMGKGNFSNYFPELANTFSALIIPNQYAATFTRPRAEYILRADDKEALNKLFEKQSIKIFPTLKNNITGVYPIISIFGEPVDQTPEGENPYMYHMFDITNNEHINNPLALEVYNLWKRTGEMPMSYPSDRVKLDGVNYSFTQQDYTYLQMLSGQYKAFDLGRAIDNEEDKWADKTDAQKIERLEEINADANEDARDFLIDQLYNGIDSGRIIVDKLMGTYRYTEPSEFDFDYAKRQIEALKKEQD